MIFQEIFFIGNSLFLLLSCAREQVSDDAHNSHNTVTEITKELDPILDEIFGKRLLT